MQLEVGETRTAFQWLLNTIDGCSCATDGWLHLRCDCRSLDGGSHSGLKRYADVAEPARALARKRYVNYVADQVINTTNTTTVNVFIDDGQAMAIPAGMEEIHRIHAENIEQFGTQPLTGPLDLTMPTPLRCVTAGSSLAGWLGE